jgi:serine/threonine protein kinase/Flp pilus assembly protein TadD
MSMMSCGIYARRSQQPPHEPTMSVSNLSDSVRIDADIVACDECGSTSRVGRGFCLNCLLRRGLGCETETTESLQDVLDEVDVRDADWRIGNYQILEEIGRGGMGVIYRARQRHSLRIVALKRILSFHADSRETLARFRREAEAAASLDHPNILPIYEVSESEDGLPFFSMKFAAGGSLLDAAPSLRDDPRRIVALMAKVTRAVQYAHGHGILHRDLKPGNILLDGCGEPLVSDFGLAKWLDTSSDLTRTLTIFGTPGYIAPEQAQGPAKNVTPAADIYSIGAVLFDLFTGKTPFVGEHALAVIKQASENPAPKLRTLSASADRDLETICAKCLEREPQARYGSAADLAEDLERWLEGRPITARPVSPPVRIWRWSKRNPKLAGSLTATVVLGMLLVAVALPMGWSFFSTQPLPAIPEKSIAVLPFENRSEERANDYFAEGIQDEILTRLSKIADLKVISRTSTQHYKSAPENLPAIAKQLGVAHILEGSVQKSGDAVRVNVQLINAANDSHLWADTFDRKFTDIFAVESEVAEKIAASLQARISGREQQALESRPTEDPEAYDLYLRGRYLLNKRTVESIQGARELFQQAVAKDPRLAIAHAGIADAYILLAEHGEISNAEASLLAWPEVSSALAIDDRLSGAHASRAILLANFDWNWPAAEVEYRKAIELNPNDRTAHHWYAMYLGELGRFDEALEQIDLARKLDPLVPIIPAAKGKILFIARRYNEAVAECQAALDLAPNFVPALDVIVPSYTSQRKFREAIEATSRYADPSDNDTSLQRAYIYTVAGQKDGAEQFVRKVTSSPESFSAFDMVVIRAAEHNEAEALRWLETAIDRRSLSLVWIRVDPRLDNIRLNPRFRELVGRVVPHRPAPD